MRKDKKTCGCGWWMDKKSAGHAWTLRAISAGLALGVLFIAIDALEHIYLVPAPSLIKELFEPTPARIVTRLSFLAIATVFALLWAQQKRVGAALSDSERLYRTLAESATDNIFVIDPNGRIVYVNAFGARQFLGGPDAIVGKHIEQLFPAETANIIARVVREVVESQQPFTGEQCIAFPNRRIWMDVRLVPVIKEGRVEAILGSARDITERKETETALKFTEERFRAIADTANDALISIDSNSRIVFWNRAAEGLFGYSASQALGLDIDLIVPMKHRQAHKQGLAAYIKTGRPSTIIGQTAELVGLRKDKSEFPLELSVAVWKIGEDTFFTGIIRDITERRHAEEEREEVTRLSAALNDINAAIASTLDFDEIMRFVVSGAAKAVHSESASIILLEDDKWLLRYLHNLPLSFLGARFSEEAARPTILAAETNEPLVINDPGNDDRIDAGVVKMFKLQSVLAVPFVVKGKLIGGLFLNHHTAAVPFSEQQVSFTKQLAAAVAPAIENAHLYEKQQHIADTLQEALLEAPERIPGVDFECRYRAASELGRVGGDFYDIFALDRGRVGIVVGDVSGKGLPAAGLTSVVKSTIKAYAYEDESPALVMAKVNEAVAKAVNMTTFVTVFFGILDTRSGLLRYCSAGHPPAIIKIGDKAKLLATRSPAIGIFPTLTYVEDTYTLGEHDILIIYTDGITEARQGKKFFGEIRLVRMIKKLQTLPARRVPQIIFDHVVGFTGGNLADDVVLLAISRAQAVKLEAAA